MKEKSKSKLAEHLGATDFLKFMHDGQPEWSLLAVKAPIDEVSDEFADFRGANSVLRDVPRKAGAQEHGELSTEIAVVQVREKSWTIIFRSLLYVEKARLEAVAEEAKELSARLNTRVIS